MRFLQVTETDWVNTEEIGNISIMQNGRAPEKNEWAIFFTSKRLPEYYQQTKFMPKEKALESVEMLFEVLEEPVGGPICLQDWIVK